MFTFKFPLPPLPSISPSHSGRPLVKPGSHHHPPSSSFSIIFSQLTRSLFFSLSCTSFCLSASPPSSPQLRQLVRFLYRNYPSWLFVDSQSSSNMSDANSGIQTDIHPIVPFYGENSEGRLKQFYGQDKTSILPLFHALTVALCWENRRIYTFLQ